MCSKCCYVFLVLLVNSALFEISRHSSYLVVYSGNFHKHKFVTHQQTRQEKNLQFLILRQGHDMTTPLTNLRMEIVTLPGNSACIWMSECHIVWVAVSKELPCQRKWANSEDSFTVMAMTGKLILGCKKFPQFCSMFVRQNGSIFCWVTGSMTRQQCACLPQLVVSKKFMEEEISMRRNFCELVLDCENLKISALQMFPAIQYVMSIDWLEIINQLWLLEVY